MNSLFNFASRYKSRSILLYTLLFMGLFLVFITIVFLIYRSQASIQLSKLNYDTTISENNLSNTTPSEVTTKNPVTTLPIDPNGLPESNSLIQYNSPSQYSMFPSKASPTNWDLYLGKEALSLPKDNIDLEYYDKWTSFYLDKKFLVDGISKLNKIYIPSISVDSPLEGLEIKDVGNSKEYETPDKIVGYIPSTIQSDKKNIWFFGHLESPLHREGSVFNKLPEIPDLLRAGEDVFVYFDDEFFMYKYKVISSLVIHEHELNLYDSDRYSLTLVTCVPKWVYDHRLVLTAELYSYAVK